MSVKLSQPFRSLAVLSLVFLSVIMLLLYLGPIRIWHWVRPLTNSQKPQSTPPILVITVVDSESLGLPAVALEISHDSYSYQNQTDNDGRATIRLEEGLQNHAYGDTVKVDAEKSGYEQSRTEPRFTIIKRDTLQYLVRIVMTQLSPEESCYVVRWVFYDGGGGPVNDIEIRRDGEILDTASSEFRDSLRHSQFHCTYVFSPCEYFDDTTVTIDRDEFSENQRSYRKDIYFSKLLFTIQCVDTTGVVDAGNMGGIRIATMADRTLGYTNSSGRLERIPLPKQGNMTLKFESNDDFPQQERPVAAWNGRVARVVLDPRVGSLTLTVLREGQAPERLAEVTLQGDGLRKSLKTDKNGRVSFVSPRIRPGELFNILVPSYYPSSFRPTEWNAVFTLDLSTVRRQENE